MWNGLWRRFVNLSIAIRIDERGGDFQSGPHFGLYELALRFLTKHTPRGEMVIDVGCGFGYGSRALASAGYRVFGCDPDLIPLKSSARAEGNLNLFRARGERLPFRDSSFSAAVAIEVVEHSSSAPRFLEELGRVVRPGGWLFVTSPEGNRFGMKHSRYHIREWELEELEELLGGTGWEVHSKILIDQAEGAGGLRPTILERFSGLAGRFGLDAPLPSRMTCILLAQNCETEKRGARVPQ